MVIEAGNRELDRALHVAFRLRPLWKLEAGDPGKARRYPVVAVVPAPRALLDQGKLGVGQGGGDVRHAEAKIRRRQLPSRESSLRGSRAMLPVEHVAAGIENGARRDILVVGDQHAALAGIDMLVALKREASRGAERAGRPPAPSRAVRVRAILNQRDVVAAADLDHLVHVGDVAAHVRQEQVLRAALARLAIEIVQVDDEVVGDLDENVLAARMGDGAWYGRQREAVHEHAAAGPHSG